MGKHLAYNYTNIAASSYGDHWRNLRRIGAVEIFSSARLNTFSDIRKDEVRHLLVKLSQNARNGFAKVELKSMLNELTFNIIMRMVAGKRYYGDDVSVDKEEARQFREIMRDAFAYGGAANPADFLPVLNWFGVNGYEKKVKALAKRADVFLQGLIDERRSKGRNGSSMIDHLLSLQESQPEYYTDQIIKGLIMVILLAGTDTSAVTLEWAMSNLLNHPRVLQKAKSELDAKVGKENLVDEPDISKLPYLQSIISETLRLCPAAPLLLPHFTSDDCIIGGFDVPRDTMVLVNAWAVHRDPELWDEPESFKPERFESGEDFSHKLIPFGMGRRACPGAGLAQRVVGLTLGSLIQCFDWNRVGEEMVDMTEGKGLTAPKAIPLEAMCKARTIYPNVLLFHQPSLDCLLHRRHCWPVAHPFHHLPHPSPPLSLIRGEDTLASYFGEKVDDEVSGKDVEASVVGLQLEPQAQLPRYAPHLRASFVKIPECGTLDSIKGNSSIEYEDRQEMKDLALHNYFGVDRYLARDDPSLQVNHSQTAKGSVPMVEKRRRNPLVLTSTKNLINSVLSEGHRVDGSGDGDASTSLQLPPGILRLSRAVISSSPKLASLDDSALVGLSTPALKRLSITSGSLVIISMLIYINFAAFLFDDPILQVNHSQTALVLGGSVSSAVPPDLLIAEQQGFAPLQGDTEFTEPISDDGDMDSEEKHNGDIDAGKIGRHRVLLIAAADSSEVYHQLLDAALADSSILASQLANNGLLLYHVTIIFQKPCSTNYTQKEKDMLLISRRLQDFLHDLRSGSSKPYIYIYIYIFSSLFTALVCFSVGPSRQLPRVFRDLHSHVDKHTWCLEPKTFSLISNYKTTTSNTVSRSINSQTFFCTNSIDKLRVSTLLLCLETTNKF
ncbi:unnamed protein product [Malus baccata var. baccata]